MIKVVIIGAGNVATHLYRTFSETEDVAILQVYNRNPEHLKFVKEPEKRISDLQNLENADVYLIAIKDEAIPEFVLEMPETDGILAHTSGSQPMNILNKFENFGVFYPLQTFSKNKQIDFKNIPVCLEANTKANFHLLKKLAEKIAENTYEVNSEQRKALHLSAVFVNNFTNHMFAMASEYCRKNELPFDILRPLIRETVDKIESLDPIDAQTGPALRNDKKTIQMHLEMLDENQKKIYTILTESIQKLHGKKL
ncbi:DUF2520 domain-containing protein [Christiangramia fulva]|uniref:DUF2520 domain-containing protein n=1 Tax=Christiangramia fulva TaxID=2126553 RepID=A0A2R3Z7E1_9FLAO|nr:Rossmann-like and DUF2520 domain-containing protein [Christiangramia fulva]AVR46155.1 DUF2520 domain-containing protein [Christiangramia fulva]